MDERRGRRWIDGWMNAQMLSSFMIMMSGGGGRSPKKCEIWNERERERVRGRIKFVCYAVVVTVTTVLRIVILFVCVPTCFCENQIFEKMNSGMNWEQQMREKRLKYEHIVVV